MSGIPKRFKSLIETKLGDVETPDYVWLTYSVCAMEENSCGWGGWLIEGAFKKTAQKFPTGTGDKALPAVDKQICPQCGKVLFRTEASVNLKPMENITLVQNSAVGRKSETPSAE